MRKVATIFALIVVLTLPSTAYAGNDCVSNVAAGKYCQKIEVPVPSPPPGAPGVPPAAHAYFGTYYLYADGGTCASSLLSNDCRGVPFAPGSGVPTPAGSVALGIVAILYQESNSVSELQRTPLFFGGGLRQPDRAVLA